MLQKTALVLLSLVPLCRGDDKYSKTNTQSWGFLPAGQVELRVRYGDVHIVPGDDSHIVLSYTMHSNHSDFDRKVEPQFEVKGSKAVLTLKAPTVATRRSISSYRLERTITFVCRLAT